jgi:hypothetical protein
MDRTAPTFLLLDLNQVPGTAAAPISVDVRSADQISADNRMLSVGRKGCDAVKTPRRCGAHPLLQRREIRRRSSARRSGNRAMYPIRRGKVNRIERRNFIHGVGLAGGAAAAATRIESPALAQTEAPTGARPVNYEPKRNRYCDWYRDQTFLAQSLAMDSSIPVAISRTIPSLKNGVANENSLIVPAAMITILCQPQ